MAAESEVVVIASSDDEDGDDVVIVARDAAACVAQSPPPTTTGEARAAEAEGPKGRCASADSDDGLLVDLGRGFTPTAGSRAVPKRNAVCETSVGTPPRSAAAAAVTIDLCTSPSSDAERGRARKAPSASAGARPAPSCSRGSRPPTSQGGRAATSKGKRPRVDRAAVKRRRGDFALEEVTALASFDFVNRDAGRAMAISQAVKSAGLACRFEAGLPLPDLDAVFWTRHVPSSPDSQAAEPSPSASACEGAVRVPCVAVVVAATSLLAKMVPGPGGLLAFLRRIQSQVPGYKAHLLVVGWERELTRRERRDPAFSPRRAADELWRAVLTAQGLAIRLCSDDSEAAEAVAMLSAALAALPYAPAPGGGEGAPAEPPAVRPKKHVADSTASAATSVWIDVLHQIPMMSAKAARGIASAYKSFATLMRAYQEEESEAARRAMLRDVPCAGGGRHVGAETSRKVYEHLALPPAT